MSLIEIVFWFLSGMALVSAIMVLLSKNPVHSVLWLIAVFFAISGHYILLNAQFLAIVNLIVYAGAIMVLFLFVIMLMNQNAETEPRNKSLWIKLAGAISGGSLLIVIIAALRESGNLYTRAANDAIVPKEVMVKTGDIGLIEQLGTTLFTQFVVPFEISSVLFLSAMVGAVVIGKKD